MNNLIKKINQIEPWIGEEEKKAVAEYMDSGAWLTEFKKTREFEKMIADYVGSKYALVVSNGTVSLITALLALDLKQEDEVIVPDFTMIASANAIVLAGAKPVFVDINKENLCLDLEKTKAAIGKKTKVIMLVALNGRCPEVEKFVDLAKEHNLFLIEDAAQAHGARIKVEGVWRMTGSLGDSGCFSFYPSKPLGALGDAGGVTTNYAKLAEMIRALRNYGSHRKHYNRYAGVNSRLDELQAAVLSVKLKYLDLDNAKRRQIARTYLENIKNSKLILPGSVAGKSNVWHLFVVRTANRAGFMRHLFKNGIEILIHYPIPPHKQKAYAEWNNKKYPVTEEIHKTAVSLPLNPAMTQKQVMRVIKACNTF